MADYQEHLEIWLQPWCLHCARRDNSSTGRTWCADNVYDRCEDCGRMPVKYLIAADQPGVADKQEKAG